MKRRDILLDANNNIVFDNYDIKLTEGSSITSQKIKQYLSTVRGEWKLNEDLGINYREDILVKNPQLERIKSIFIKEIQSIEEVVRILSLDIELNKNSRSLSVDFKVEDNQGYIIEDNVDI